MHADEAFRSDDEEEPRTPGLDAAAEFLRRVVGPGPVRAAEVYVRAEAEGLSEKTLKRAKLREGIESYQLDAERGWWWQYPSGGQGVRGSEDPEDDPLTPPGDPGGQPRGSPGQVP
jgi:hypothetical protein